MNQLLSYSFFGFSYWLLLLNFLNYYDCCFLQKCFLKNKLFRLSKNVGTFKKNFLRMFLSVSVLYVHLLVIINLQKSIKIRL